MRSVALATVGCVVLFSACVRVEEPHHHPEESNADSTEDEPSNHVAIPQAVRKNLGITFARVEAREVERTLRVPGAFELLPLARREYRLGLPGRVELLVDQYERVETGQPLYRFQSPAWPELLHEIILSEQAIETASAEIELARAKQAEVSARLGLVRDRIDALAEAEFKRADLEAEALELSVSLPRMEAELQLAETRRRNAESSREHAVHRAAMASNLSEEELLRPTEKEGEVVPLYRTLDWIEVRAVAAGVVERLHTTDGAFLEAPSRVLTIVDPERVRFRALALQGDLPRLTSAQEARIVPPRSPGLSPSESVEAEMELGLEAHPEDRTLTLLATPKSPASWIRPGISAFLEIVPRTEGGPSLAIPLSAVVQDGVHHVFFLRDPDHPDEAIRVEADLGGNDGRWVVVESGLKLGDEVVLAGAYELKLATERSGGTPKGGHFHADGQFHDDH